MQRVSRQWSVKCKAEHVDAVIRAGMHWQLCSEASRRLQSWLKGLLLLMAEKLPEHKPYT